VATAPSTKRNLIMSSIADFGETRVRDVMVPRIDIVLSTSHWTARILFDAIVDAGHSRIPV